MQGILAHGSRRFSVPPSPMIRRYCGTARKNGALTSPPRASDPFIATPRLAEMPFRRGGSAARECHLYFARRVTFLTCADIACRSPFEKSQILPVRNVTATQAGADTLLPFQGSFPVRPFRATVLSLVRDHYIDFGPTLAAEKLMARHGLRIGVETLRQWTDSSLLGTGQTGGCRKRRSRTR